MRKLFGTDGIRDVANTKLTAKLAFEVGQAGALVLAKEAKRPKIMVAQDTRRSCDMLVAALTAGICSVGADVINLGVLPTPGLAVLIKKHGADAGVMVSASHNAFGDNGIKFISRDGFKLPDATEAEIEAKVGNIHAADLPTGAEVGCVLETPDAITEYVEFLKKCVNNISLKGLTIALDCANGAAYQAAPAVFEQMGAAIHTMFDTPDGININSDCGSTHPEALVEYVKQNKVSAAFAFDGDGDRCFAVDENGNILDGDMIMSIMAVYLKQHGLLTGDTAVSTVMANLGFAKAANEHGFKLEQVQVGDRYVLEKMKEGNFKLGGEQSGHIILLDHQTTGDGVLTALMLVAIMAETGKTLSQLNTVMTRMPQVIINAHVPNDAKNRVMNDTVIQAEIAASNIKYRENGRVFVRASGTEPVVRVTIEGADINDITAEANRLAKILEDAAK